MDKNMLLRVTVNTHTQLSVCWNSYACPILFELLFVFTFLFFNV